MSRQRTRRRQGGSQPVLHPPPLSVPGAVSEADTASLHTDCSPAQDLHWPSVLHRLTSNLRCLAFTKPDSTAHQKQRLLSPVTLSFLRPNSRGRTSPLEMPFLSELQGKGCYPARRGMPFLGLPTLQNSSHTTNHKYLMMKCLQHVLSLSLPFHTLSLTLPKLASD